MSPSLPFSLRLAVSLCPLLCPVCPLFIGQLKQPCPYLWVAVCVRFPSFLSTCPVPFSTVLLNLWWIISMMNEICLFVCCWDTLFKTPVVDGIHHIPTVGKAVLYGLKITSRCTTYISLFWNLLKRMNDRTVGQNQISQCFWPNASIDISIYMTYFDIFFSV